MKITCAILLALALNGKIHFNLQKFIIYFIVSSTPMSEKKLLKQEKKFEKVFHKHYATKEQELEHAKELEKEIEEVIENNK